jgi:DNA-binding beta-propeller fold protein YncE
VLTLRGFIALPPHTPSEFDHGDVHRPSGRVFVAHTAAHTVEVLDGTRIQHVTTIPGCREGSGVLCAQDDDLVFAAARGAGKVLVIAADSLAVKAEVAVGPRPNGLAWDTRRKRLLVADVQENTARLIDPVSEAPSLTARTVAVVDLPGRPRWCVYDDQADRFLVNIREPACVVALAADTAATVARWPVGAAGPHGLDLDGAGRRAFVACDGAVVVALDLATGRELGRVPIAGAPDAIWYNSQRERLYVAIEDPGILAVVNTRGMTLDQEVATEAGAHTTAYDDQRQRLYVFLPTSCRVAVYDEV